jgi:tRNA(adenine34) deaminase
MGEVSCKVRTHLGDACAPRDARARSPRSERHAETAGATGEPRGSAQERPGRARTPRSRRTGPSAAAGLATSAAIYTIASHARARIDGADREGKRGVSLSHALNAEQTMMLMRAALEEAARGLAEGEAPIGCVIARPLGSGFEIVARGHNRVSALRRWTAHAEMLALEDGAGRIDRAGPSLVLVSTLEPCIMCFGACIASAIATVVYGLVAPADSGGDRVQPPYTPGASMPRLTPGPLAPESRRLFAAFLLRGSGAPEALAYAEQLLTLTAAVTRAA